MTPWYGYAVWLGYTKCSTVPVPVQPIVWEPQVYLYPCATLATTLSGHWNVSSRSSTLVVPQAHVAPPPSQYYPMDLINIDGTGFECKLEQPPVLNPGDIDNNQDGLLQESGVSSIKVKPPKAKRYANSVSC